MVNWRAGMRITAARLADISFADPWHDLSLLAGWQPRANFFRPSYRLIPGDRVELTGAADSGDATNGTVVATVPSGYRPSSEITIAFPTNGGHTGGMTISTNGDIQLAHLFDSAPTTLHFAGSFPVSV